MYRTLLLLVALVVPISASAANVIQFTPFIPSVASPVGITNAGDERLFIVQQSGTIAIHDSLRLLPSPFLDISSLVRFSGEQGLLGLAFHPRYAENGFFFVNYTDRNGDTVIARYQVSANDRNRADPTTRKQLLFIDQPYPNHNGGDLQFGPDGYLYIGMGDGGSGGDPENRAQSLNQLLGKMLRIDVDGSDPYAIPPTNPFLNTTGPRPEIWAYGLRNPWRFSFDRETGDMWIADVGQGLWEEVSFQPVSSIGGENYGWDIVEGTHCFPSNSTCSTANLVMPLIEYSHATGGCSVTGGYVYRGVRYPRLRGMYIYGDYCSGKVWAAQRNPSGPATVAEIADTDFSISAFGEDANGELYLADLDGAVYRIHDPRPVGPRRRAVRP